MAYDSVPVKLGMETIVKMDKYIKFREKKDRHFNNRPGMVRFLVDNYDNNMKIYEILKGGNGTDSFIDHIKVLHDHANLLIEQANRLIEQAERMEEIKKTHNPESIGDGDGNSSDK